MPPRSTTVIVAVVRGDVALDDVAGVPDDVGDRRIEAGERPQRAVAQAVARGAGVERLAHEADLQQALVGPRDADGDRLGLVLDRVDRPGELLDGRRERDGEILDDARVACRPCRTRSGTRRAAPSRRRSAAARRGGPRWTARGCRCTHRSAGRRGSWSRPARSRRARLASRRSPSTAIRRRHPLLDRRPGLRGAARPGRRWPAPPRSRTGGRPSCRARTRAAAVTAGTVIVCIAAPKRWSPSVAMTIGVALWAR